MSAKLELCSFQSFALYYARFRDMPQVMLISQSCPIRSLQSYALSRDGNVRGTAAAAAGPLIIVALELL